MKVKVTHISNDWKPVRVGLEKGYNMVVVTQALENANFAGVNIREGKTLKLNLNSEQSNKYEWISQLSEGNVLDVQLRQQGKTLFIDKYKSPQLIRKAENGTHAEDVQAIRKV